MQAAADQATTSQAAIQSRRCDAGKSTLGGTAGTMVGGVRLIDRGAEKRAISGVLDSVRRGMSGTLVLRGEPGVGMSALLGYALERAADLQIVRMVALESERSLGFAAVHQLLVPLLRAMDRLPEPQRRALGVAFGMVNGPPADPFLVGLAVLTLLSDAAEVRPVLCVIDDAQWLDEESAGVLIFVARRLLADRVGLLFAVRETVDPDPRLQALPGLRISGLPKRDAHEVLERSIRRPTVKRCFSTSRSCARSRPGALRVLLTRGTGQESGVTAMRRRASRPGRPLRRPSTAT